MRRSFVLVVLGSLLGCSSSGPALETVDCSTATVPTYGQLSEALAYCVSCHGESRADEGVRYDTYASAKQHAASGAREIESGAMPDDTTMPDDLAQQFVTWAQCGTPQ